MGIFGSMKGLVRSTYKMSWRIAFSIILCFMHLYNTKAQNRTGTDYRRVIKVCDEQLKRNPNDAKYYIARAEAEDYYEEFNSALDDYNKYIQLQPNDYSGHFGKGVVCFQLNRSDSARLELKKTIRLKNKYAPAYCYLGMILQDEDSLNNAINYFTISIQDSNSFIPPLYNRGLCLMKLRLYKRAIKDFQEYIKISNLQNETRRQGDAFANEAYCYAKSGQDKPAEQTIDYLYKIDSTNATTLEYKGLIYIENKEYQKGCLFLKMAKEHGNGDASDSLSKYCK